MYSPSFRLRVLDGVGVPGISLACEAITFPLSVRSFEVGVSASGVAVGVDSSVTDGVDAWDGVVAFSCPEAGVLTGRGEESTPWLLGIGDS